MYALSDAGFQCVIAPSFGDIFAANAVNNGPLPARVAEPDSEALLRLLTDGFSPVTVDREASVVCAGELHVTFHIDPVPRIKLLNS